MHPSDNAGAISEQPGMTPPAGKSNWALVEAVIASTIGTTIEWYDFFLYGTAAGLIFPKLFFPDDLNPFYAQILSYATFSLGFVGRLLGSVVFGYLGDRVGRKSTLVATLLLMGVSTVLIGCMPTYGKIGIAAPLLLAVLRIAQGLGVGGEWGGSVLLVLEYGHRGKRGFFASLASGGSPARPAFVHGRVVPDPAKSGAAGFQYLGMAAAVFFERAVDRSWPGDSYTPPGNTAIRPVESQQSDRPGPDPRNARAALARSAVGRRHSLDRKCVFLSLLHVHPQIRRGCAPCRHRHRPARSKPGCRCPDDYHASVRYPLRLLVAQESLHCRVRVPHRHGVALLCAPRYSRAGR